MTDEKKTTRCPHCGYMTTRDIANRPNCPKCGRPLKVNSPPPPEVSVRPLRQASP